VSVPERSPPKHSLVSEHAQFVKAIVHLALPRAIAQPLSCALTLQDILLPFLIIG
jgi:hypothetical protein